MCGVFVFCAAGGSRPPQGARRVVGFCGPGVQIIWRPSARPARICAPPRCCCGKLSSLVGVPRSSRARAAGAPIGLSTPPSARCWRGRRRTPRASLAT
eukprot:5755168-Lingulodinium_polyedra.AAC.1